jgi:hypothetical protein
MTVLDFESVQVDHTAGMITIQSSECTPYPADLQAAERFVQAYLSDFQLPADLSPFRGRDGDIGGGVICRGGLSLSVVSSEIPAPLDSPEELREPDDGNWFPEVFGNYLAMCDPDAGQLLLLQTGPVTEHDLLDAQVWAVNLGAAPLDEWSSPDISTDFEGNTWIIYTW